MRNLVIYASALASLSPAWAFRPGPHQLRDLLAFPKYSVDFLNETPLSATDAAKCRSEGVELEDDFIQTRFTGEGARRRLSGNDTRDGEGKRDPSKLELVPMKLPSLDGEYQHEYLCLMPSVESKEAQMAQEEEYEEIDPAQGWAALSHLDGKCLYSKQGWFTYSYCHNDHIRQFRAAPHKHPHPPGGFVPEENQQFEAYTLGQATRTPSTGKHGNKNRKAPSLPDSAPGTGKNPKTVPKTETNPATSVDRLGRDHAVSYGLKPSSRYLVQRWSDGTRCDMTNKPREIEVQVHCSMTTTDSIYLIKETSICNYVMIIHSPHLCGLPGFKADHSDVEIAKVRCREVISDADFDRWINGEAVDMPFLTIGRQGYLQEQEEPKEEETQPAAGELGQKQKQWETVQLEEGMTVDEMKDVLAQLLGSSAGGGGGGDMEGEEELMLITLDDEGEEPVVLQADFLAGQGEAQGGMDRETIVKFVKEYLKQKERPKRSEDEQDKKNKAARAKEEL